MEEEGGFYTYFTGNLEDLGFIGDPGERSVFMYIFLMTMLWRPLYRSTQRGTLSKFL